MIKPDVVLYEEPLDDDIWQGAWEEVRRADTLIVGGSSLTVTIPDALDYVWVKIVHNSGIF